MALKNRKDLQQQYATGSATSTSGAEALLQGDQSSAVSPDSLDRRSSLIGYCRAISLSVSYQLLYLASITICTPTMDRSRSMRLPLAMALRRALTMLAGTYRQRLRLPSFHDSMNARCFRPSLHALQFGRMHGLRTSDTDPFAAGQRDRIWPPKLARSPSVDREVVFMHVCIAYYIHTSQNKKGRKNTEKRIDASAVCLYYRHRVTEGLRCCR